RRVHRAQRDDPQGCHDRRRGVDRAGRAGHPRRPAARPRPRQPGGDRRRGVNAMGTPDADVDADGREPRRLPWDWHPGVIPANVAIDATAYVESSFSFCAFRSRAPVGVEIGPGASTYGGTMFDVGPRGRVSVGRCAMVNGAQIVCDERVEIGDHALISWNVVIMDTYRVPADPVLRRRYLEEVILSEPRGLPFRDRDGDVVVRPV